MNEDFWNELMAHLLPNITIFPWYEKDAVLESIALFIDWEKHPQHFNFGSPEEIMPLLNKLLKRTFDETVYVYAPHDLFSVFRAPLKTIVQNYEHIYHTDYLWLWNPAEGYVVEDDGYGRCTVGLVPKTKDPYPYFFECKKSFFLCDDFSLNYPFRDFSSCYGLKIVADGEANKVLASFQATYPLTPSGEINWREITRKTIVGKNPGRITLELEKIVGSNISQPAYIEWNDENLPLIQVDLNNIISHYGQLLDFSLKTTIFDPMVNYAIEIAPTGEITLGSVEQNSSTSSRHLLLKNTSKPTFLRQNTPFHKLLKSFGIEIIMDEEANTILAHFQHQMPFTRWGNIDWDKFEKKIVIGKNPENVLSALAKLLNKPLDSEVYVAWKEPGIPLVKINFTTQTADCWPIWVNAYGAFLFNLNQSYVIEVDVLGRIEVGFIPERIT